MSQITHQGSKDVLYHRMLKAVISSILLHCFLATIILLITHLSPLNPLSWPSESLTLLTSLRTLTHYLILTTIIILQGIITTKSYSTPPPTTTTRFSIFCSLFTPTNITLGGLHMIIGIILVYLTLLFENFPHNSLTKTCKNTTDTCLNEFNIFFTISGLFTGIYHFTINNLCSIKYLEFPVIPQTKFTQVRREIYKLIPNAMTNGIFSTVYFICIYYAFGGYLRGFITTILFLNIEDEGLNGVSMIISCYLIIRIWLFSFLFDLTMKIMNLMLQVHLTEWMEFDMSNIWDNKSFVSLTDALGMDEVPIIQHLGYLDLFTIAQKQKSRRGVIFSLSQPGGHPYNWNSLVEKCMGLIRGFTKTIDDICCVKNEALVEVKRVGSGSERPYGFFHMRNLVKKIEVSGDNEAVKPVETTGQMILEVFKRKRESFLKYLMGKPLIFYFFGVRNERRMQNLLINGQMIIWAVEAISSLAVVSLEEDRYGIVQKDLAGIVEGLLGIKLALEKLQKVNLLMRKPQEDDKEVRRFLGALRSANRRSIYRIVRGFKVYFEDLGIEGGVKEQLQGFFSCRE